MRGGDHMKVLTAIGLENVRMASEVNLRASDMSRAFHLCRVNHTASGRL